MFMRVSAVLILVQEVPIRFADSLETRMDKGVPAVLLFLPKVQKFLAENEAKSCLKNRQLHKI